MILYSTADGKSTQITSGRSDAGSPAWSRDGKWLYFLSERTFQSLVSSPWGARQPEPFFDKQARIYAIALQKGLRSPFLPSDELHAAEAKDEKPDQKKDDKPATVTAVAIDLDGIQERQVGVPIPAGNYSRLTAGTGRLFFL